MEVRAFEICCERTGVGVGIGKLDRPAINQICGWFSSTGRMFHRLGKNTKVRVEGKCYSGYCFDVNPLTNLSTISLDNGQLISIPWDSFDLYDTSVEGREDFLPRIVNHITPEWLSDVLTGPKYQPAVVDFTLFRVPETKINSLPKVRLRYYTEGECVTHPNGKPKLIFIKLGGSAHLHPSCSSAIHTTVREKREAYTYTHILHSYSMQIAPISFFSAHDSNNKTTALVMQDLALWKKIPPDGVEQEAQMAQIASALGILHGEYFEKGEEMNKHFIKPRESSLSDLMSLMDGVKEAFEAVLEHIKMTHYKHEWVSANMCGASFSNLWQKIAERGVQNLRDIYNGCCDEETGLAHPLSFCHLNLSPEHIVLKPTDMSHVSKALFVDWRFAHFAPIGLDLASVVSFCQPSESNHTSSFIKEYHKSFTESINSSQADVQTSSVLPKPQDIDNFISKSLIPLLLITVCLADDHIQMFPQQQQNPVQLLPHAEKLWKEQVNYHLQRVIKVTRCCADRGLLKHGSYEN